MLFIWLRIACLNLWTEEVYMGDPIMDGLVLHTIC